MTQPTTDPCITELWTLANGDPCEPCILQARWLLRGLVNSAEEVREPLAAPDEPADLGKTIRKNAAAALAYLRKGQAVTPAKVRWIAAAGREADAIEILRGQGREAEWPTNERTNGHGNI